MHPILLRYGPFMLYSYSVALGLGVLGGLGLTAWLARTRPAPRWFDSYLLVLAAALAGGRLAFVLLNWPYFEIQPAEAWQIWRGGLSYYGALPAALAALWLWTRGRQRPFTRYADLLAPALALVSAAGWVACYLEGCAYGRETVLGPLAANLPDAYGLFAVRYQTQVIGMTGALAVLGLILWLRRRRPEGAHLWLTLGALSLVRLPISLLRDDPFPTVAGLRLDSLFESAVALSCLLLLQLYLRHQRSIFRTG
jgi:phosphatidylglycerol---prolipoprotein diacylglyceryl transferase